MATYRKVTIREGAHFDLVNEETAMHIVFDGGPAADYKIYLADATTFDPDVKIFRFTNHSLSDLPILDTDLEILHTLLKGTIVQLDLTDMSTVLGNWQAIELG